MNIIKFTIGNYRSIKDPVTFSMVAGKSRVNTFFNKVTSTHLLKTGVIYGANASGKSNILRFLFLMHYVIPGDRSLFSDKDEAEKIEPFLLDDVSHKEPTLFEIHLTHKNMLFIYRIELLTNTRRVYKESLRVKFPDSNRSWKIFDRIGHDISISSNLPLKKHGISRSMIQLVENDSLFVTSLGRLKKPTIAHDFIEAVQELSVLNTLVHHPLDALIEELHGKHAEKLKDLVLQFLGDADISIVDLQAEKQDDNTYNLNIVHKYLDSNGLLATKTFPLEEESDGTKKLLDMSFPILIQLATGAPVVLDELGSSLHPTLLRFIVTLFNSSKTQAQLIMTSHDATLMDDRKALSRDQIYFAEKRPDQTTDVYSLADFTDIRNNTPNLSKRYLTGEFGANPRVKVE